MKYLTKSGDTWDRVAKEMYGNEYSADILMKANAEYIGVFIFSAGVELTVPKLEEEKSGALPPWKYEADI